MRSSYACVQTLEADTGCNFVPSYRRRTVHTLSRLGNFISAAYLVLCLYRGETAPKLDRVTEP